MDKLNEDRTKFGDFDMLKAFDEAIELARNGKPVAHRIVNLRGLYKMHLTQLYKIDLENIKNK